MTAHEWRVKLTLAEVAHAEWALDPMRDCAADEESGFEFGPDDLPRVEGGELVFPNSNRAVVDDIVYRLTEQLPSMAKDDHDTKRSGAFRHGSSVAAARRLADKIQSTYADKVRAAYTGKTVAS